MNTSRDMFMNLYNLNPVSNNENTVFNIGDTVSNTGDTVSNTTGATVANTINTSSNTVVGGRQKRQSNPPSIDDLGDVPSNVDTENEFVKIFTGVSIIFTFQINRLETNILIMKLQEEEREAIGHDFGSMIKACTFKQRDCLNSRYDP